MFGTKGAAAALRATCRLPSSSACPLGSRKFRYASGSLCSIIGSLIIRSRFFFFRIGFINDDGIDLGRL